MKKADADLSIFQLPQLYGYTLRTTFSLKCKGQSDCSVSNATIGLSFRNLHYQDGKWGGG